MFGSAPALASRPSESGLMTYVHARAESLTGNLAPAYVPEQRALLLADLGRTAEAMEAASAALRFAGGRDVRLRVLLASAFARSGNRAAAEKILEGRDAALGVALQRLRRGELPTEPVDTPAEAFGELLLGMAVDFNHEDGRSLPIT